MHGRLLHALALYHTLMPAVFAEGRLQARALVPGLFTGAPSSHSSCDQARALVPGLPSAAPLVQQSALRLLLPQQGGGGGGAELPPAAELCGILQTGGSRRGTASANLRRAAGRCGLLQMTLHTQHRETRRLARAIAVHLLAGCGAVSGCSHSPEARACCLAGG